MARLVQLPQVLDLEWVAGDPFTLSVACTGATITLPAVTMKTAAGDAFTSDPGVPTVTLNGSTITIAWTGADSDALNTTNRSKAYQWSLEAVVNGEGPFQLVARTATIRPVGSASSISSDSVTLAIAVGTSTADLAITVGGGGAATLDELTDVVITAAASGDILRHNGTNWVDAVGTSFFEAAGAVAAHEADTTNVHGIPDTSALETTTGSASKVSTHAALTSGVHGISAFGATLVDDADQSAARTTLGLAALATKATVAVPGDITATGTPSATTFLRGDGAWATPSGGGATFPSGHANGGSTYRGVPGWFAVGAGGDLSALSQYDVYTFPIFVTQAITVTGYDINLQSGNSAGGLFRAGIYAASGTADSWQVGSLTADLNTCALDTTGAKSRSGLSVSLAAGWHVLAFGCDVASGVFYGFEMANAYSNYLDLSLGNNANAYATRWWYDYSVSNSPPTTGMPASLSGSSQNGLGVAGGVTRLPITLRWTNP